MFVKIGDLLNLKVFLSCGIPREQELLRKSKAPRKSPEKWTFLSLAFYDAPSLHTVKSSQNSRWKGCAQNPVASLAGMFFFVPETIESEKN